MRRSPASNPTIGHSSSAGASPRRLAALDRPAAAAALALLRGYKVLLSPMFAGSCRFQPSCSDYMAEAIRRHGAARGLFLGLKRLSRCRPFGGHGLDPVPHS